MKNLKYTIETEALLSVPWPKEKLKVVYSAKKKVAIRTLSCHRAELIWENKFW
jgi:hypothetical protein